jgi:hypothetical protein
MSSQWPPNDEPRWRLFKANHLDAVGWSALVAAMAMAAVVLARMARFFGVPRVSGALAGGSVMLGAAVGADRRAYGRVDRTYSRWSTAEADEVQRIAQELRDQGVSVWYVEPDDAEGPGLKFKRRDERVVMRAVLARGVAPSSA